MVNKPSAYKIYLLFSAITAMGFSLVSTVMIVYHIENVHLNPLQLILVGTTLEAACFLFEIPTGIVADVYSRKLSIVIGTVLTGLGFILEGSISSFIFVLAAQIVWGLGSTFISGSVEAWIAEEENTKELNQIYIKGAQVGQIGSVIGIVLSTIIANFSVRLPMIVGGVLFVIFSIFLAIYMTENNFKPSAPEGLNTFKKMGYTFKSGLDIIKRKAMVMILLSVTLFYGLSSEGYDRLSNAHFLQDTILPRLWNLKPVTWFGIFGVLGMILSVIAMRLMENKLRNDYKNKNGKLLLYINVFYILFMLVFAITRNFGLMLIAYLATNTLRTINEPIFSAWLNGHIDDKARATILSINGQINALGQILGGPIIGIIATNISISIGIACTSLLLTPVLVLYVISMIMDKKIANKVGGGGNYEENN
ncbi:DHA3 family tetracycline resistance protein-like MFS transporter [Clostridium acetobutylicum]|uniref:MDR-type permease, probably tetracycline resistance protein n=1 Tax=Clostridium acetobutylicum (strain ATCC 824 / DSM 792 / JCM 1419 / IAM 19013 / LMG 5710 / NBRC 13948 / NRRL B-527 / VKM B-1787 / 2291 / W) TaxID=272562 RepID=Q97J39_CLOAB|nr:MULTISPECIES: tetracycline efflux MFS transporter TetA(P) [Clostridium]AAK79415.1 MDR-type permease, probably tetracycline resistance protein [Clostridium acetobutylicum ATCC 824]ADZ20500.1 MDR-type permease, probably tetracycline resistance protein [Clostridium acetobutylicum EA 2018]AEI33354.1 MDR-type permease [Clostridium acetobutylicum DSM 1731]AWV81337.1 tetracycline efflux MFS transporter TetA(P) [Clostridium acetobutylicum]MBC2392971.1 tetracycline efflux MFS transporter TetA(P) [Cl